jgi:hypothetical protein
LGFLWKNSDVRVVYGQIFVGLGNGFTIIGQRNRAGDERGGTRRVDFEAEPATEFDYKKMGYESQEYMPPPASPGSELVMVHPQVILALIEALFDGPSHQGRNPYLFGRSIHGLVAQGKLDRPVFQHSYVQPYFIAWLAVPRLDHLDALVLADDRAFGAVAEHDVFPRDVGVVYDFFNLYWEKRNFSRWPVCFPAILEMFRARMAYEHELAGGDVGKVY